MHSIITKYINFIPFGSNLSIKKKCNNILIKIVIPQTMKYIFKMRQKMLLLASKNNVDYEIVADFKHKLAMANLKLHFKHAPEKVHGYKGMIWA